MPELRHASLHDEHLPLEYLPLVRRLDRFITDSLQLRPRKGVLDADEVETLRRQHDTLMADALAFFGDNADEADVPDSRWALALGVYRCTYYEETVVGSVGVVDTCGSLTLGDFEVDTAQGPAARDAIVEWLGVDGDALEEAIAPELDALALRTAIVEALEARHPLNESATADAQTAAMFDELYPGHPFKPGEIDVIRTATSVFFCLPFEDLRLSTPQWAVRTAEEKASVDAFLRRWSKFKQRYYAHFPVFGFFRGDQADPAVLQYLSDATDRTVDEIADALTTMISILQSSEVDKYIVHDAWGHQWQSLLFRFEETYREVANYTTMPDLDWRPQLGSSSLRDVLDIGTANGPEAAVQAYEGYLRSAVDDRLLHSLAGLVAEVLADVVEYKFILLKPQEASELLSSSFFKDLPTKLDLTLWDIPWYFKIALRGFERFVENESVRSQLASDSGAPLAVVDALAARTSELLDFDYRRSLHYEVHDGELTVNAFCRVALNFLAMQAVFNDVYDRLRGEPAPTREGIRRFHDVLVFATASFFELDWREHFWLVDEFLGMHFENLWREVRDP